MDGMGEEGTEGMVSWVCVVSAVEVVDPPVRGRREIYGDGSEPAMSAPLRLSGLLLPPFRSRRDGVALIVCRKPPSE